MLAAADTIQNSYLIFFVRYLSDKERMCYLCNTRTPKPLNNAQIGGRFFIYTIMAINFEKSYTSTDAIVGILQERGLNVDNQEQAADILKNVGYYRGLIVGDGFLSLCVCLIATMLLAKLLTIGSYFFCPSLDGSLFLTPLWTLGYRVKVDI